MKERPSMRYGFRSRQQNAGSLNGLKLAAVIAVCLGSVLPAQALKIDEVVTSRGIKAWLVEEHSVPLVAVKFAFAGGAAQDQDGKEGVADLLSGLLTEGAGDLNAAAFKRKLSSLGAQLSVSSGRESITGGLETLSKRLEASAELLRLTLLAPRFDPEAVDRLRLQRLNELAYAANEPRGIALDRWYAEAFQGHAYGRPIKGTEQSVARITRDDIQAQHIRLLARDTLKIIIVGDVDKNAAAKLLDAIFGDLPAKAQLQKSGRLEAQPVAAPIIISKDQPLATAAFGLASLGKGHADFPALQVLNHIIGSGDFDSTLMEEIRVKRGLAYSINTSLLHDSMTSLMLGGVATKNENMGEALGVLKDVLARTARDGPTTAQFDNAKRYLTGSFLLDFDTNSKIASSLLRIWLDDQGVEYLNSRNKAIERVTLDDVKRVARQVLQPDRLIITIVGRPSL
jgi:zinc protease